MNKVQKVQFYYSPSGRGLFVLVIRPDGVRHYDYKSGRFWRISELTTSWNARMTPLTISLMRP